MMNLKNNILKNSEYGQIFFDSISQIQSIYDNSSFGGMYTVSPDSNDEYTSDQGLTYPANEFNLMNGYVILVSRMGLERPNPILNTNAVDGFQVNLNYGFDSDTLCGPMMMKIDITSPIPYFIGINSGNSQQTTLNSPSTITNTNYDSFLSNGTLKVRFGSSGLWTNTTNVLTTPFNTNYYFYVFPNDTNSKIKISSTLITSSTTPEYTADFTPVNPWAYYTMMTKNTTGAINTITLDKSEIYNSFSTLSNGIWKITCTGEAEVLICASRRFVKSIPVYFRMNIKNVKDPDNIKIHITNSNTGNVTSSSITKSDTVYSALFDTFNGLYKVKKNDIIDFRVGYNKSADVEYSINGAGYVLCNGVFVNDTNSYLVFRVGVKGLGNEIIIF